MGGPLISEESRLAFFSYNLARWVESCLKRAYVFKWVESLDPPTGLLSIP